MVTMQRRAFTCALLLAGALLGPSEVKAQAMADYTAYPNFLSKTVPPNILFIFTDDQSHRSVHSYEGSYPWAQTPNIDRLAREGVRFTTAYCGTWCAPRSSTAWTSSRWPRAAGSSPAEIPPACPS